jgi:hypothetical protein
MKIIIMLVASVVALEAAAVTSPPPCEDYETPLCCGLDEPLGIGPEADTKNCMPLSPGLIPSIFASSHVAPFHVISLTFLNQATTELVNHVLPQRPCIAARSPCNC